MLQKHARKLSVGFLFDVESHINVKLIAGPAVKKFRLLQKPNFYCRVYKHKFSAILNLTELTGKIF